MIEGGTLLLLGMWTGVFALEMLVEGQKIAEYEACGGDVVGREVYDV